MSQSTAPVQIKLNSEKFNKLLDDAIASALTHQRTELLEQLKNLPKVVIADKVTGTAKKYIEYVDIKDVLTLLTPEGEQK